MKDVLLEIKNLSVTFPSIKGKVKAVDNISLSLRKGETLGLVGESGSGKSLTALSIMKLIPQNACISGKILFKGQDILKMDKEQLRNLRGNKISMIYQDPMSALNPTLTIGEQIVEVLKCHNSTTKSEEKRKVIEILEDVGIPDPEHRIKEYPYEFSGGMRQRVLIAMAIINKPDLILADEPTTALDVTIQAQILHLLTKLKKEFELSMVLITHDLGVVSEICDRIAIMYAGKIMEVANTDVLYEKAKHPYTKALMDIGFSLEENKDSLAAIPGVVPSPFDLFPGCRFQTRCKYAKNICFRITPELKEIDQDHYVACHLVGK